MLKHPFVSSHPIVALTMEYCPLLCADQC